MTDGRPPAPTPDADGTPGDVPDSEDVGEVLDEMWNDMVRSLGDLLDEWLDEMNEATEQGVDPTPLLYGLARVMRSAADQLDPTTDRDRGGAG